MTDLLAATAIAEIDRPMTVGLGTGRAAARAIRALARRAVAHRLALRCVATSRASRDLAHSLGLSVEGLSTVGAVDYLFDGADEVDGRLRLLKGRGGAMTEEKRVARAARRRVYLVQADKLVPRLGTCAPLPVEVRADRLDAVTESLSAWGLIGPVRIDPAGARYRTDGGNPVLDLRLPEGLDLEALGDRLDTLPGVVGHGLFLREADEVLVEDEHGHVTRLRRPAGV